MTLTHIVQNITPLLKSLIKGLSISNLLGSFWDFSICKLQFVPITVWDTLTLFTLYLPRKSISFLDDYRVTKVGVSQSVLNKLYNKSVYLIIFFTPVYVCCPRWPVSCPVFSSVQCGQWRSHVRSRSWYQCHTGVTGAVCHWCHRSWLWPEQCHRSSVSLVSPELSPVTILSVVTNTTLTQICCDIFVFFIIMRSPTDPTNTGPISLLITVDYACCYTIVLPA